MYIYIIFKYIYIYTCVYIIYMYINHFEISFGCYEFMIATLHIHTAHVLHVQSKISNKHP